VLVCWREQDSGVHEEDLPRKEHTPPTRKMSFATTGDDAVFEYTPGEQIVFSSALRDEFTKHGYIVVK
jgi:hypothetical protein